MNLHIFFKRYSCQYAGPPWRILFFGTDTFSLGTLKPLCSKFRTQTLISRLSIVCKPKGEVFHFAKAENLPMHCDWPLDGSVVKNQFDIGIVSSFGKLIPSIIIDAMPLGIVNVHASLLPRWRGAAPHVHTIMQGDSETGVTIFRIRPRRFDIGDIVRQWSISVGPDETSQQLYDRLSQLGGNLIIECVRDLPRCIEMAVPQSVSGVTYAPLVDRSMSVVDWCGLDAREVYNLHRALAFRYPLVTSWHGHVVKLLGVAMAAAAGQNMQPSDSLSDRSCCEDNRQSAMNFLNAGQSHNRQTDRQSDSKADKSNFSEGSVVPGRFEYSKQQQALVVQCRNGGCLLIDRLTIKGKTMSAKDFKNGYLKNVTERKDWRFT